jgi:DNA-binding winged helix-turn-helix (wHTH) protein
MSLLLSNFYRFGPFDLDPDQRVLRRDGKKIALQPKAFDLLLYLVQNPLRLLTKEELLGAVWPDSFVEEGNLSQNIFLLRKAITPKQKDFRYIVTLPGRGYQFAATVELIPHSPSEQSDAVETHATNLSSNRSTRDISNRPEVDNLGTERIHPPKTEPSAASPTARSLRFRYLLAALFTLALVAASFLWWKHHHPRPASEKVVLADFDNRTGDAAFDDVLDTALEIDLSQSPYLDVMSDQDASNVLRLMGRKPDAPITEDIATEICQRADRQVMLSGSVSSLGRHYLLALQATDCFSGHRLA